MQQSRTIKFISIIITNNREKSLQTLLQMPYSIHKGSLEDVLRFIIEYDYAHLI